jgi:hypothetical protein
VVGLPLSSGRVLQLWSARDAVFQIEASTNPSDWTSLGTVTNTFGLGEFIDADQTGFERRFYRARDPGP